MSQPKWANTSNFMACLLQYLIRREHSCFKAKCLPELFVINLGIAGCHNQNRLISFPSEGQGLGDSSRAYADRLSCLFNTVALDVSNSVTSFSPFHCVKWVFTLSRDMLHFHSLQDY